MSRRLAVLVACALVLAPLSPSFAQTQSPSTSASTVTDADRAGFRQGLAASGAGPTFDRVRENFPEEYATFETDIVIAAKSGKVGVPELQQRTFTFMKSIRDRVMPHVKQAPTPALIGFGEEQRALMKSLLSEYPRLCYEYVEFGGASMDSAVNTPRHLLDLMNVHTTLQFEVALAGQRHPAARSPMSKDDVTAAVAEFNRREGDSAWINAVATGKPRTQTDTQRCQAAITWIDSILSLPAEQAARMLAG